MTPKQTPASHPEMPKCIRCGAPCCTLELDECDEPGHQDSCETVEGWVCSEYCWDMLYTDDEDAQ